MGSQIENLFGGGSASNSVSSVQQKVANSVQPSANPLQNLLAQQQQYATQFRNNLGTNTSQAISNNNQGINNQLMAGTQQTKSNNAGRGMAYGGVNQGQLQGLQSQAQTQAASQGGQIQQGLLNQANQMDMNAISTGVGLQQQQQQMQNAIYGQAMAQQQSQNSMFGSAAGLGMMAFMASDIRLKKDIVPLGKENGFNIYEFSYRDDIPGLRNDGKRHVGVIAQDVIKTNPDAVVKMTGSLKDYYAVSYNKIGVKFLTLDRGLNV